MNSVRLHPEAELELEDAETYYEQIYPELRLAFRRELEVFAENISAHPKIAAKHYGSIRRYVLIRFPYSVYYEIKSSTIVVYAIGHNSRRPLYWRGRSF